MTLDTVTLVAPHRKIVDADGPDPAINQVLRGRVRDVDKLRIEMLFPPVALRVPRLEQNSLALANLVLLQLRRFHRVGVFDFDDAAGADQSVERDRVQRRAVLDEMIQTVHVCAGVGAHVHFGNVAHGALVHVREPLDADGRVGRPMDHPRVQRDRGVNPISAHTRTRTIRLRLRRSVFNDILDAVGLAQQQVAILIDFVPAGDQGADGRGPVFHKNPEVADRPFERVAIGVDRADDRLVFQHEIAHDDVGLDPNGRLGRRNAGENIDAVQAQHAQDVVRNLRRADRFVNEVDVPNALGELINSFDFAGDVFRADGFYEFGLAVGRLRARINAGLESMCDEQHRAEDSDRARAQHDRVFSRAGLA